MNNRLKKKIKYMGIATWLFLKERTYRANDTRLKYLFFEGKGDALIITFSAYNDEKPLYNYIRTLHDSSVSRLYIKDDFGADHKGSYYLGEKGKHNVEETVVDLINQTIKKLNLSESCKLIFIGSSKGGYAALNFAVMFNNSYAIVGAPQYLLGTHLNQEFFYPMLEDIIGDRTDEKIALLDEHIKKKYINKNKEWKQYVYMQYSDVEYTFDMHIQYLIDDLKMTNITTNFDLLHYQDHSEVHKFFPDYLHKTTEKILLI